MNNSSDRGRVLRMQWLARQPRLKVPRLRPELQRSTATAGCDYTLLYLLTVRFLGTTSDER
jgi:hypothetical protein